jgi:hypothetical protein
MAGTGHTFQRMTPARLKAELAVAERQVGDIEAGLASGGNAYKFNSYHLRRARQKAEHLRNEIAARASGDGLERVVIVLGVVTEKVAKRQIPMSSLDLVEAQLKAIAQQTAVAMSMVAQLRSGGPQPAAAPALAVVPRRAPMDPIREVQMLAAKYVAEGKSWDQFQDLIDVSLMQSAIKQFTEFGPGRSDGRRDPSKFRAHIMAAVPTVDKARVA